jgi:hypothetical protein
MNKFFAFLLCALSPFTALAVELTAPYEPTTEDTFISAPVVFADFDELRPLIAGATIEVSTSTVVEQLSWPLDRVALQVFLGKLQQLDHKIHAYDGVFKQAPEQDPAYDGIRIKFNMLPEAEVALPTLWFDAGMIRNAGTGLEMYVDPGRVLEYWVFGSSTNRASMLISLKSLPVFTFEQCMALGHNIVYTDPRQCVMPNEIVMLDLGLSPVVDPLTVNTFDECLDVGLALMSTFPRRCLTKGGKLVAEPPRRPDGSIILPGESE